MSGWIAVEYQLPKLAKLWECEGVEYKESLLVLVNSTHWGMRTAVLEGSGYWSDASGDKLDDVTHWRPLPKKPRSR